MPTTCRSARKFSYVYQMLGSINKMEPTLYMDEYTISKVYPLVVEEDECI